MHATQVSESVKVLPEHLKTLIDIAKDLL